MVRWEGDLPSAVDATISAAPACGLRLVDARRDDAGGSASLVLLEEWQSPGPESALVNVLCAPAPAGVSCRLEAHPLAEYGMRPQDIRAGSAPCLPCAAAQAEIEMVRYSRGLAMGNAARVVRCLREALEAAAPLPARPAGVQPPRTAREKR